MTLSSGSKNQMLTQSSDDNALSGAEIASIVLAVVWLLGSALYFLLMPSGEDGLDSIRFVMVLVAIFMPVAVLWIAAMAARSARIYRNETTKLRQSIHDMRQAFMAERDAHNRKVAPTVEQKIDRIAEAAEKTETVLATFTSSRDTRRLVKLEKPASLDDQPSLALGTTAEDIQPPLPRTDLIRALNFPDTEQDTAGFAALRLALKDRQARQLVQASQDVLTLLSQDGIYMDDMRPDRAKPEIWRRFAKGERGRSVAALGGVRDRSCLALTAARMREDGIFRDTAHHFLRRFDQMLVTFEEDASDEEFVALAETRTSRAFMLLGRVTGAFD